MKAHVVFAIFRRNFISYFSNPTGYVFLCVFVLLSGFAAFWPHDFWVNNLANLDQLNRFLPYILLIFIPAITMGIWAEERRLGTDELLLTIPASDLEVVLGKFLAAVAIYSVSLLFSMICNLMVLFGLGNPDLGLFFGMYFGYWLVGVAMLSVGMVGSFLTSNMTIAFILGALFNAPLVFLNEADLIFSGTWAARLKGWSISGQFADLGRGVISLSSVAYFVGLTVVSLYLCVVLIGRRHWRGGPDSPPLGLHYLERTLSLLVTVASLVVIFSYLGIRVDVTAERINSLSPDTLKILSELNPPRPVRVLAFLSPRVPEPYVQTRLNLINVLEELRARAPRILELNIVDTEPDSEEALRAEDLYGIEPREVMISERGAFRSAQIYLGVVFECGLEKVVVPFIDRGTPVEYEMIRAMATVARGRGQSRKTVAVVRTDAPLFSRFDPHTMSSAPEHPLIEELKKQYNVEQVSLDTALEKRYDVLLAIQPSSLGPEQMKNFIAAVRSGQPTAIFEDPLPAFFDSVPGTTAPRRPMMRNPFMPAPTQPKGDIEPLWAMLGVHFHGDQIIWQDYNPYPRFGHFPKEFVFVRKGELMPQPFNEDNLITRGMQELLFPFPGFITRGKKDTGVRYSPLVRTSEATGTLRYQDALGPFGRLRPNREAYYRPEGERFVLAAHLQGRLKEDQAMHPGDESEEEKDEKSDDSKQQNRKSSDAKDQPQEIHVVLVADIDCLHPEFYAVQQRGEDPLNQVNFRFQNVAFVHNVIDYLAGDHRFLEVRKRQIRYRTLERIESLMAKHREDVNREISSAQRKLQNEQENLQQRVDAEVKKIEEALKKQGINLQEAQQRLEIVRQNAEKRFRAQLERLRRETNRRIRQLRLDLNKREEALRRWYKFMAVGVPPIFPLLMGIVVFVNRLARERESVSRKRLRNYQEEKESSDNS